MNLCSLHLHKWSKWSGPYVITVQRPDEWGGCYRADITTQSRTCTQCNEVQDRIVSEGSVTDD